MMFSVKRSPTRGTYVPRHFPEEQEEFALTKERVLAMRAADKAASSGGEDLASRQTFDVLGSPEAAAASSGVLHLHVLGSGSKGNCAIVDGPDGAVMVDCGFSRKMVKLQLEKIGFDESRIVACLVTHEHTDHIKGVDVVSRWLDIPVYSAHGTCEIKRVREGIRNLEAIGSSDSLDLAGIHVDTFPTSHDAADPFGMRFTCGDDAIGYMTDTGYVTPQAAELLANCRILALESNHDPHMLQYGPYPSYLKARIASDEGHLSNVQSQEALEALLCDKLEFVLGMHLSQNNNEPDIARNGLCGLIARNDHPAQADVAWQGRPTTVW